MAEKLVDKIKLENGLTLEVYDRSRRRLGTLLTELNKYDKGR